jgi:hypothetical protein
LPVEVGWHVRYRVIGERYWGNVDAGDINQHIEACVRLLTDAEKMAPEYAVHLFADGLEAERLFPLYKAVAQGIRPMTFSNRGVLFLVTGSAMHRMIVEVTARVGRFPMQVFGSRQDALNAVAEQLAAEDRERLLANN